MKTLIALSSPGALRSPSSADNYFTVYKIEHSTEFNVAQELPEIFRHNTPVTTVNMMQGDKRDLTEQVLTYFLENEFSCRVSRADFGQQAGEMRAGLALTGDQVAVRISMNGDFPLRDPNHPADFFDMLRKLDEALREISEHIRGINDPNVLDARLKQLKASAEALRCYIDLDNEQGADVVPRATVEELNKNLQKADLSKLSAELREWAKIAKDYAGLLLKYGVF